MAGVLAIAGPLMSMGGSLFGMMGGGNSANNVPAMTPAYQPTGLPQADQNLQSGINQMSSSTIPSALSTQSYLYNNPGTAGAVQGANVAGGMGEMAGLSQFGQGQNLTQTGNSLVPYATQALNTGFDPMGNVYNQQFQQNTDQTRALMEARGIDSTPYGAGVEAQSNLNFNNAWEQNALQRQQTGAGTATNLLGQQASDVTQGQNLAGQAPGTYYGGASMPYNTAQTIGTNQFGALGQSQQLQQQPLTNWMNYMNYGNAAAGQGTNQFNAQLNQQNQGFQQGQTLGNNLGAGIAGLSKAMGGSSAPATGGWATNSWAQNNPGVAGSVYQGPVA